MVKLAVAIGQPRVRFPVDAQSNYIFFVFFVSPSSSSRRASLFLHPNSTAKLAHPTNNHHAQSCKRFFFLPPPPLEKIIANDCPPPNWIGVLVECDPSIKAIILKIDQESHDYIIEDLDDETLVIKESMLPRLKARLDEVCASFFSLSLSLIPHPFPPISSFTDFSFFSHLIFFFFL